LLLTALGSSALSVLLALLTLALALLALALALLIALALAITLAALMLLALALIVLQSIAMTAQSHLSGAADVLAAGGGRVGTQALFQVGAHFSL
jgi:hypothetical protein